ncbi:YybH family protein [Methyloceanibacter methanicus]|nr:nuclear transport factor 2 family protein [Methyloceanibacter methanicus]
MTEMSNDEVAVRAAVDRWVVVLNAMLNGDPKPLEDLYSHADDVTYMGAEGTFQIGWDATCADWKAQAENSTGGQVEAAGVHVVVSGNLAAAQHYTRGQVRQPDGRINETNVRESSVFRKENGAWKMIAHHADGLPYWEKAFA